MSEANYSEQHPHEPEIEPIYDSEGRCLICSFALAAVAKVNTRVRVLEAREHTLREALSWLVDVTGWPSDNERQSAVKRQAIRNAKGVLADSTAPEVNK